MAHHQSSGLPAGLQMGPQIGKGRRSLVFRGEYQGRPVAVKQYTPEGIAKYRRRYGLSIAQWEHDRNLAFWEVEDLQPFVARPLAWQSAADARTIELFVQEFVTGESLRVIAQAHGGIPRDILETFKSIVDRAEAAGLHDIDLSPTNMVMQQAGDRWKPVIFDFNMVPQHIYPPNPWVWLLYRIGYRHPSHRDRWMLRRLEHWPD